MTFQILCLFIVCLIACRTDIKTHKVRNKDLIIFLMIGIGYYAILLTRGIISNNIFVYNELKIAGANFAIAFAVSFAVRLIKIWPAGDAKLFTICNLLIPVYCYKHVYFTYFPGATLLINIFIAGLFYIFFLSLRHIIAITTVMFKKQSIPSLLKVIKTNLKNNWSQYTKSFSSYIIVFIIMSIIYKLAQKNLESIFHLPHDFAIIVLFICMKPLGTFVNSRFKGVNHAMAYILYFIYVLTINNFVLSNAFIEFIGILKRGLYFLMFYGIIRYCAELYILQTQTLKASIDTLREGYILSKETLQLVTEGFRDVVHIPAEGLTRENIDQIRSNLALKDIEFNYYKPMPFAPIIFCGVFFSIATGLSAVQILKDMIMR